MVNLAVDKYHNLISHAYWPHPTIGSKQKFDRFGGGGRGGKHYYLEVHETFRACPLFEFQKSLKAIEGTTAASSKEMQENVHND